MTMYSAVGFSMLVESREILDHAKHQPLQQTIHLISLFVTYGLKFSINIPIPTNNKKQNTD